MAKVKEAKEEPYVEINDRADFLDGWDDPFEDANIRDWAIKETAKNVPKSAGWGIY